MENIIKEVDCALIFMLDEERDLFLEHNSELIITSEKNNMFVEFIFFDKNMSLRKGVICSNGKKMGNSEAVHLFYMLSRKYKAHLYINLGVAGLIDDMNIGDVLVVERLSTMGENNANNTDKQLVDLFSGNKLAISAVNELKSLLKSFSDDTANSVLEFKKNLKSANIATKYKGFERNFKDNKIMAGHCVTVSEVIKDISKYPELKKLRKINLIDMEAYYIALWHNIVKNNEPNNSIIDSDFLAFKSVSDYGDENKPFMEQFGSRNIAMKNLCTVVTAYCTKIYTYKQESNTKVYDYLSKEISEKSLDSIVNKSINSNNIPFNEFEQLFDNFSSWDEKTSEKNGIVSYAMDKLSQPKQALLLTGRSGTGKSTFLSYLYKSVSSQKRSVLIDFSKFSSKTIPTDCQIVSLIEGLIIQNMDYLVFIDGLRVGTPPYDRLKKVLDYHEYSNLGFCIGNIDDDFEDLYNIVSGKNNINEILFYGVSVCHPQFNKIIDDSSCFFLNISPNYKKDVVRNFIKGAKLTSVDFRLLTTFANYTGDLTSHKSFYSFIKSYLSSKYKQEEFNNYWKNIIDAKPSEIYNYQNRIDFNTYFASFSIAQNIINAFSENNIETIKLILKMNYILSDDMNSIFEFILKNKKQYGRIVNNMIAALDQYESSISTETQLLYNISRTITKDNQYFKKFENLVSKKIKLVEKKLKNTNDKNYYNYIIEYRTLSIVLNACFQKKDFLQKYNNKLIEKDIDYSRCNLAFHLFYYAKRSFDFNMLNEFDFRQASYEMISNAYYILENSLKTSSGSIINDIIAADPQFIMNIVTLFNILDSMIDNDNIVIEITNAATEFIREILENIDKIGERNRNNKIIESLRKLSLHILNELECI